MSKRIITHLTACDLILGGVIQAAGAYKLKADLQGSPFKSLARAIANQQLNGTAANTILNRFIAAAGNGDGAFPTPEEVLKASGDTLRACGFSQAKVAALKDLAAKTIEGVVPDQAKLVELSDLEIIERLTQVRGIGRWTVEMMLIFQLGRKDVLPVDDFGVRNGFRLAYGLRKMPEPKVLGVFGERWAPHRSAAAWYLWRAVDLHRAGTLPPPVERVKMPRLKRRRRKAVVKKVRPRQQKRTASRG